MTEVIYADDLHDATRRSPAMKEHSNETDLLLELEARLYRSAAANAN